MDKIHLYAPRGWINDPNGFIYYGGNYHLFYQHFPYATRWGRMHWGHAVSDDLTNWEHLDIALFPSKANDSDGCFSGSAIEKDGRMHIFYTGVKYVTQNPENINCGIGRPIQCQMHIVSNDGYSFDNFDRKTTVIPPIEDPTLGSKFDARDPKVWQGKDGNYYMVIGSTVEKQGRLLIYKSADLESWELISHAQTPGLGHMWECPDYFEIDGQGFLIMSPMGMGLPNGHQAVCVPASFDETTGKMTVSSDYKLIDCGLDIYAPQSNLDKHGNRTLIPWLRMPKVSKRNTNGLMGIPRICTVKNEALVFAPHPNIKKRFSKPIISPVTAENGIYRILVTLNEGESISVGQYKITAENGRITADASVVMPSREKTVFETPILNGGYNLDIYVDENIIETFVNDGESVITNVFYGDNSTVTANTTSAPMFYTI